MNLLCYRELDSNDDDLIINNSLKVDIGNQFAFESNLKN